MNSLLVDLTTVSKQAAGREGSPASSLYMYSSQIQINVKCVKKFNASIGVLTYDATSVQVTRVLLFIV